MHYDPIKQRLGKIFNTHPLLRILFYNLLNVLLLRSWHIRKEIRSMISVLSSSPEILDAGSGFGQYSWYMARKFRNGTVTGVDIKEEQVDDCNAFAIASGLSGKMSFMKADLTRFQDPGRFNLILSVDVMEHIEDDHAVFHNFCNSLKEGGILLISTPSDQGGSDVHEEGDLSFIEEHVRNGYNMNDMENKLAEAGFQNIQSRFTYGKPGNLSWKLSMKYPVTMLNISPFFYLVLPFYYIFVFPFCLLLNLADVLITHRSGTGLIVKAIK